MAAIARAARDRSQGGTAAPPALIASETWTGANGAAWPAQWTGTLGSGATRTIQGNRGQLVPIPSAWSGDARAYLSGMPETADVDVLVNALAPSPGNIYFSVAVRCDGVPAESYNPQTGYTVEFGEGSWWVKKHIDFVRTDLGTGAYALSATVPTWIRFQVQGTTIRFRAWQDGAAEPSTWTWTGTDTAIATGKVWLAATNGGAASSVSFDGLTISGYSSGSVPTSPGSVNGPAPAPNVPGVPTAVTAASDVTGQATIRWQPPASNGGSAISGWLLGRDGNTTGGEAPWNATFDDPAMREATFYNLAPAQTYNLYVAAVNGSGTGPSASVPVVPNGGTTTTPQPLIDPPTTFSRTAVAGGFTYDHEDVTVPAGATLGYYQYRVGTTNPPSGNPVSTGTTSAGTVGSLPATAHYFQVRAVNTNGQAGNWSVAQGPITPLASSTPTPVVTVTGRRLQHPFWSTPLAENEPLASTSSDYVTRLATQAAMGPGTNPGIPYGFPYNHETSVGNYSLPIYQIPTDDWPRQPVWHTRTRAGGFQAILDAGVPVPNANAMPDGQLAPKGTDGALIIFDPFTRELWEFWQWRPSSRAGYTWEAEQGGYIRNIDKHPGWWAGSSWYGGGDGVRVNGYDWGVSACGQSYLGSLLTGEDFHGTAITHPLSLGLPITGPAAGGPTHLLPASRYDWLTFATGDTEAVRLPEGARFRLPHAFDIAAWVSANARPQADVYGTTAATLQKLLVCLRDYGLFIGESAGVVQLMGEHDKTFGTPYNPFTAGQKPNWGNLGQSIPWSSLVQIAPPTVDISVPGAGPS